jgi:BNR repeat-like domain
MRLSPDEAYPQGELSAFTASSDGGHSWSRRFPLGAGGNPDAAYGQPEADDLYVLGSGYDATEPDPAGQTKRFRVVLTRFSRSGMQIDQRRDAILELRASAAVEPESEAGQRTPSEALGELPQVQPWGSIIRGQNGDWLTTVYYKIEPDPRYTRVVLVRSTDRGLTWRESGLIAGVAHGEPPWSWIGNEGPSEAAMVRLADGQLLVLYRTGGSMGEGWSHDDGKSWTTPRETAFRGVAPRLRKLANGMLACTFGRPGPVSIMFSGDGSGREWSNLTPIYSARSTAYSDFVEISPGKIFVVYDNVPYGSHPIPATDEHARNAILGAFVELSKK